MTFSYLTRVRRFWVLFEEGLQVLDGFRRLAPQVVEIREIEKKR